ncbi:hypothetical protein [Lactococcus fujiensis]|uniref:hypothetical protein n=1 Tax=Lactococcus fujiensis TaxID=610251 RepID=UPI0006CF2AB1|nr:hypothetical protein [Lactococcus fujiensis]
MSYYLIVVQNQTNTNLTVKKEEAIAQFWKSDDPEPMPNAVAQTEYQNPELRKQKEETEKDSAGFGDLLKGWFKKIN